MIIIKYLNMKKKNLLKMARVTFGAIFFALITLLFLDVSGTLHLYFGWLARIQFLPAVLAVDAGVVLCLVILTLFFGRIYCSVICPLGVFQDGVSAISGSRKGKKARFSYSPAVNWLRYTILAIFLIALVAGLGSIPALLAPYSSYGRIAQNLFAPIYALGNNLLAWVAERAGSYAFYTREVWIRSIPTFVIALVTFVAVFILAWKNGRTYCNTICPVGTVLGFLSKYSIFKVVIDTDKCIDCGLCARKCKASCINAKEHKIDYSRCVDCFDCIDNCSKGAISYKSVFEKKKPAAENKPENGKGRRAFMTGAGMLAGAAVVKAQEAKMDGGLALILDKKVPKRSTRIVPAGAQSLVHIDQHCTGCQLCVATCPNGVLRPSNGLMTLMKPESSYERGYCRPECTKCSEVCPTGAIQKISVEEKSSIRVGHAVWVRENCIPVSDGVSCGNCARHCPAGAIQMVHLNPDDENSLRIPVVNEERCIGCGACENLCPSRPFSAIYVEGHEVHSIK